jgi:hypothetical protein
MVHPLEALRSTSQPFFLHKFGAVPPLFRAMIHWKNQTKGARMFDTEINAALHGRTMWPISSDHLKRRIETIRDDLRRKLLTGPVAGKRANDSLKCRPDCSRST